MSQSAPPETVGQPEGPNPLEVFFEKNKKWIYLFGFILLAALGADFGVKKMNAAARDKNLSAFTDATGLSLPYTTPLSADATGAGSGESMQNWLKVMKRRLQVVGGLMDGLEDADRAQIDELTKTTTPELKPWMLWIAACKAYAEKDYEVAQSRLSELKSNHATHLLCAASDSPPQVRADKESQRAKRKRKKDDDSSPAKDKPELEDAVKGSPVDNLSAAIAANLAFKKAHPAFFDAPKPDMSETAIIKFNDAEIEIAFYPKAAREHVARFKKSFSENFYKDMRIHKIMRDRRDTPDPLTARTIHLGNANTRETDRAKWSESEDAKDEDILDFESGIANLSCFPFMVCAESEKDGKSSALRFFICVNDGASTYDGESVVFGRVIRGMDFLKEVADGDLADFASENLGKGLPRREIQVVSSEIKKK